MEDTCWRENRKTGQHRKWGARPRKTGRRRKWVREPGRYGAGEGCRDVAVPGTAPQRTQALAPQSARALGRVVTAACVSVTGGSSLPCVRDSVPSAGFSCGTADTRADDRPAARNTPFRRDAGAGRSQRDPACWAGLLVASVALRCCVLLPAVAAGRCSSPEPHASAAVVVSARAPAAKARGPGRASGSASVAAGPGSRAQGSGLATLPPPARPCPWRGLGRGLARVGSVCCPQASSSLLCWGVRRGATPVDPGFGFAEGRGGGLVGRGGMPARLQGVLPRGLVPAASVRLR